MKNNNKKTSENTSWEDRYNELMKEYIYMAGLVVKYQAKEADRIAAMTKQLQLQEVVEEKEAELVVLKTYKRTKKLICIDTTVYYNEDGSVKASGRGLELYETYTTNKLMKDEDGNIVYFINELNEQKLKDRFKEYK